MQTQVRVYVLLVAVMAMAGVLYLHVLNPAADESTLRAGVAFALLGLACQVGMHPMNRGVGGAMSFIPFVTASVMAPTWQTPIFVGIAIAIDEVRCRREPIKAFFNVSQHALASAASIVAFVGLGGVSLQSEDDFRLLAYCASLGAFFVVNTGLVSGVLALTTERRFFSVWEQLFAGTLKYDVIASPLVYVFAVMYNRFTLAGIILLVLVLLGSRQLYKTNRELEQTNRDLLEVMVAAIELRDPYTSGHSQRVCEYSTLIARAIGLNRREVQRVGVAALLHDVGKIDQRFAAILQKPGRLTEEERAVIELHPVISADLVSRVAGLADVVPSVRHHHERWDGRGYPDGLAELQIPLYSRIITFADTIDAMTSDRPYRPALGMPEVRAELLRNRGKQFDPDLCDRLLASPLFQELFDRARTAGMNVPVTAPPTPTIAA